MSLARSLLLRASRSTYLAGVLRRRRFVGRAAQRFMPGEQLSDALGAARALSTRGIGTVLTKLGENVTTLAEAQAVERHYVDAYGEVERAVLSAQLSIKLTQLGLDVDRAACERAVRSLAARAGAGSTLWIDMEDSRYADVTLDLYRRLRADRANVGVCLQAYLRRTPDDLEALLPLEPAIRLVKGAYAEAPAVAFPKKSDVDAAYLALATRLLDCAARGKARPVFGTHDMRLVSLIRARAAELKVPPRGCEFHMLYGIREKDQLALAGAGEAVRVLISYGSAWFAWYLRRLAERPANVWFVVKNLV